MRCFRRTMRGHHYLLSQKFSGAVRISLEEAWVYRTTKNHLHLVLFFKILARQRQILVPFLRYEDHHQTHGKTRAWNSISGNKEMSAWEYTAKSFQKGPALILEGTSPGFPSSLIFGTHGPHYTVMLHQHTLLLRFNESTIIVAGCPGLTTWRVTPKTSVMAQGHRIYAVL